MIGLIGPVSVPEGAAGGSPWISLLLLALFVAAAVGVVLWDNLPARRKPPVEDRTEYTHRKAA